MAKKFNERAAVILASLVLWALLSPVFAIGGEELLVTALKNGNAEIYLVGIETGESKNITNDRSYDCCPNWSADGSRVVFCSDRDGSMNVFAMDADGSNVRQLTRSTGKCRYPSWSPDGKTIVYSYFAGNPYPVQLIAMNSNGTGQRILANGEYGEDGWDPAWSTDGKSIAFAGWRQNKAMGLFLMDASGRNIRTVFVRDNRLGGVYPSWSPDGKRIAFADAVGKIFNIYTIAPDGSGLTQITSTSSGPNFCPSWSADGKRLAYIQRDDKDLGTVVVVDVESRKASPVKTPMTASNFDGERVVWRPRR